MNKKIIKFLEDDLGNSTMTSGKDFLSKAQKALFRHKEIDKFQYTQIQKLCS